MNVRQDAKAFLAEAAHVCCVAMLSLAANPSIAAAQSRWAASSYPGESEKAAMGCAACHTDESWTCVVVRCEATGRLGLYADIAGAEITGPAELDIDGRRFPAVIEPTGGQAPYSNTIAGDTAAIVGSLRTGTKLTVRPEGFDFKEGYGEVALKGSGGAIAMVTEACRVEAVPSTGDAAYSSTEADGQIVELGGLNATPDCAVAASTGTVADVKQGAGMPEGFWFEDKWGRHYINIDDLPAGIEARRRATIVDALNKMIVSGNRLEIGTHGCGASGTIEKLVSVKPALEKQAIEDRSVGAEAPLQQSGALDIPSREVDPNSLNAKGVALNRSGDETGGFELIKQAADTGDPRALANLGVLFREGVGTPRDIKSGNDALKLAASKGDSFGVLGWGLSYQNGTGVLQSSRRAYEIWLPELDSIAGPEIKFWAAQGMDFAPYGVPDAGDLPRSFELCSGAEASGHRPAYFYCNDYSSQSADRKRTLKNIETAVVLKPWMTGLNIEKLYVKEHFSDSDETIRALLGYSIPPLDSELGIDLAARVTQLGFKLEP